VPKSGAAHGEVSAETQLNQSSNTGGFSPAPNLNPTASVFIPKKINGDNQTDYYYLNEFNNNNNEDYDYDYNNNHKNQNIYQYENQAIETLIQGDESDKEIWIPKYQDCDCCQGFVFKCKGPACLNMEVCYCKATDECDFNC